MRKSLIALATAALLFAGAGLAHADIPKKVQKRFAGQLLVTDRALQPADTPAATIKAFEKLRKAVLPHESVEDGVASWTFHYTAFMKRAPRVTEMSVDFYTSDGKYVANKRLMGVNPKYTIVTGVLHINEDDGLTRGKNYVVKLTGSLRGKEVVFAKTRLQMK